MEDITVLEFFFRDIIYRAVNLTPLFDTKLLSSLALRHISRDRLSLSTQCIVIVYLQQ